MIKDKTEKILKKAEKELPIRYNLIMATSELNNYKKNVQHNIARIKDIVEAIREGRLPDISEPSDTKDEFSGVISDIYKMADDMAEKIKKLEADNKNIEKKTAKSIAQIKLLNKEN